MGPEDIKKAHHELGLSASKAAKLFHVSGGRTVRRWWLGERPAPGLVITVTKAMIEDDHIRGYFLNEMKLVTAKDNACMHANEDDEENE